MATVGEVFDFTITDSSLIGLLQKINSFTDVGQGGILGIFILLIVGGGLFLMMKSSGGSERSFAVSGLVTSIIGVLLRILQLINDTTFWVCISLSIISIIFLIKEQGQYE